jgi:hypothetical protein
VLGSKNPVASGAGTLKVAAERREINQPKTRRVNVEIRNVLVQLADLPPAFCLMDELLPMVRP